jgi:hypothetical protein
MLVFGKLAQVIGIIEDSSDIPITCASLSKLTATFASLWLLNLYIKVAFPLLEFSLIHPNLCHMPFQ